MSTSNSRVSEIGKSFCTEENLIIYLSDKSAFSAEEQKQLKYYIDNFSDCWHTWNKVRWDAAMNTQGVQELKEYLGDKFVPYYDSSWGLAEEWIEKKPHTEEEIKEFYKHTENYVYNLVVWHESGDRENYNEDIIEIKNKYKIESVIDYGCGVGTDSIFFLNQGLNTYSIDYSCPATSFLKWRFEKRKIKGQFIDIENITKLPKADMFWAIDVLEHIPDPIAAIKMVDFNVCKVFAHRSQFNDTAGGRHPCHINFEQKMISDFLLNKGMTNIEWQDNLSVWVNLDLVNTRA